MMYMQGLNLRCYEEIRIRACPFVPKYYILGFLLSLLFCYLSVANPEALRKLMRKRAMVMIRRGGTLDPCLSQEGS